ncbi:hypothetical protein ACFPRL_11355 [Pseudoclavibacter helvolus]
MGVLFFSAFSRTGEAPVDADGCPCAVPGLTSDGTRRAVALPHEDRHDHDGARRGRHYRGRRGALPRPGHRPPDRDRQRFS